MNSATNTDLTFTDIGSSYAEDIDPLKPPMRMQEDLHGESTEIAIETQLTPVESTGEKAPPQRTIRHVPGLDKLQSKFKFKLLQKWEGTVIEIDNEVIRAQIQDLLDRTQPLEEVTFSLDEVSKPDRPLVVQGAVFYWMIGYLDLVTGQRTRESRIVFRRLPEWKKAEIETLDRASQPLIDLLPDEEAKALRKHID